MHPALSHLPKLSKGRITPNVIRDFENHAENFFMNAKHGVLDNKKVTRILGCFKDRLVNDWISVNCKRLHTLEFEQFMDEFCSHWLLKTWVEDLWNNILGSRLDPKLTTFEVWASKIQTLNIALRGMDSHLDDDLMCRQLEANIDLELHSLARKDKVPATTDFLTWMAHMTELDNDRQSDRKRIGEIVNEKNHVNKCPYDPSRSLNPNQAKGSSNAASVVGMTPSKFPPKLTEEEWKLLQESKGCFKC